MITIEELFKRLGDFQFAPISLEVNDAQILVVLGRNGSGKTTLLNLIAGILQTDQGKIFVDKILLNGMPLEKRKIGYVFQRLYLFPHLDVFSNITFGSRNRKDSEFIIKTKEMISMLGNNSSNKSRASTYGRYSTYITMTEQLLRRIATALEDTNTTLNHRGGCTGKK